MHKLLGSDLAEFLIFSPFPTPYIIISYHLLNIQLEKLFQ